MRLLLVLGLTVAAFAQHSRGSAPRSYGYGSASHSTGLSGTSGTSGYTLNSFGNSVYPGGLPSSIAPPRYGNPNALVRGGAYRAPHPQHGRTVVVPYPVYLGGYNYGYGYMGGLSPEQPPVQQGYDAYGQPQQQSPPVVIINQAYRPEAVNPQFRDYSNMELAEPMRPMEPAPPSMTVYGNNATDPNRRRDDDKPTIYLIALKEGPVMPALAFWVDNDTLNYITREGSHNRVSLDRVDRDFSVRLNQERNLDFRIP